ncbi:MAG TPA: transposase [Gaiellaceae bacterium]|nr:transposase [Gaiellaceae bacterium]
MARSLRHEHPGAVYHVTSRGNGRGAIFLDRADETSFFETLTRVVRSTGWVCHAYCLMPNHFHLLLETPKPNLARGMQRLNSTFAQRFNRRHARIGHVLQGRYHAVLIEKEPHLLEVCRYVVLNPVRARLCSSPATWAASSYRATAGHSPSPAFLTVDWLLEQIGGSGRRARERYRAFVAEGVDRHPLADVRGQIYLGSEEFARTLSAPNERIEEVPRAQWQPVRHRLDELLGGGGRESIAVAFREGYTLREIADHLGVHVATVSRRLRRLAA